MRKIALIGDLVASRKMIHRSLVQQQLKHALKEINERQDSSLKSLYTITLGDEFQAIFTDANTLFKDAVYILSEIYPEKSRFSIGIGDIDNEINESQAIGMYGSAFYNARDGMEELKKTQNLFTVTGIDGVCADLVKQSLYLIFHYLQKANENRLRVLLMLCEGLSVKQMSGVLEISDTAVYKNINSGKLKVVSDMFETISIIINKRLIK